MTLLLPSRTGKTEFYVRPYHCQNAEFGVTQDELNIAHLHDLQVAQLAISLDFISDIGVSPERYARLACTFSFS